MTFQERIESTSLLALSLVTLVLSFPLSLALFVGGWLVYGAAHIIDGFVSSDPQHSLIPPVA